MAAFRILPSGKWNALIRKKGHPTTSKTFRTKAAAADWARDRESAMDRGEVAGREAHHMTVADLLDWHKEQSRHKKGFKKECSRYKILKEHLGSITLAALTVEDVVAFARKRKVGSDTIRRDLSTLSAAIEETRTIQRTRLPENVAASGLKVMTSNRTLKKPVRRDRRTRPGEVGAILGQLSMPMARIVAFALETAMRRSEIAKVKESDIRGNMLLITDDKVGNTVEIPLSSAALEILAMGPLWEMKPDSITQAFKRACKRAGISGLRPHDLRHEAISRLFDKGLAIEEVAQISRHGDWRSLKIYTHPSKARIAAKLG